MARCLQTLVLARGSALAPSFGSIEEYLGRNRRAYFDVLAEVGGGAWQPQRDPRPWIRFCLTAHYRQAATLLLRLRDLSRLRAELDEEIGRRGLAKRTLLALADAAVGLRVRNATYRPIADIGDHLASRDLKALVDQGLLVPSGEKRGRHYLASEFLRELRQETRNSRKIEDPFAIDPA